MEAVRRSTTACAGSTSTRRSTRSRARRAAGLATRTFPGRGAADVGRAGRLHAAAGRRLRPLRQRQDGAEVRRQQVQPAARRRPHESLQPDPPADGQRHLARSRRRRHRRRLPRLQLPDAGLRDQPRAAAGDLRPGPGRLLGHRDARDRSRVAPVRSIRTSTADTAFSTTSASSTSCCPRVSVNAYWFYSKFYDLARTDNVLQSFSDYTPVDIVEPARWQRDHDVQRQRRGADAAAEPGAHGARTTRGRTRRSRPASTPGCRSGITALRRHGDRADAAARLRRHRRPEPPAVLRRLRRRRAVAHADQAVGRRFRCRSRFQTGHRIPDLQALPEHGTRRSARSGRSRRRRGTPRTARARARPARS